MLRFGHSTLYWTICSYYFSSFQAYSLCPSISSFSTWNDDGDYDYSSHLRQPYDFSSHPRLFSFTYDLVEAAEIIILSLSLTFTSTTVQILAAFSPTGPLPYVPKNYPLF